MKFIDEKKSKNDIDSRLERIEKKLNILADEIEIRVGIDNSLSHDIYKLFNIYWYFFSYLDKISTVIEKILGKTEIDRKIRELLCYLDPKTIYKDKPLVYFKKLVKESIEETDKCLFNQCKILIQSLSEIKCQK